MAADPQPEVITMVCSDISVTFEMKNPNHGDQTETVTLYDLLNAAAGK